MQKVPRYKLYSIKFSKSNGWSPSALILRLRSSGGSSSGTMAKWALLQVHPHPATLRHPIPYVSYRLTISPPQVALHLQSWGACLFVCIFVQVTTKFCYTLHRFYFYLQCIIRMFQTKIFIKNYKFPNSNKTKAKTHYFNSLWKY